MRTSITALRALGLPVHGFVTPSAKWFPQLGRVMRSLSLTYSSNFGFIYDALPFEVGTGEHRYIEIPVHPISTGNFLKAGLASAITDDELYAYFSGVAEAHARSFLPIFLYGHNNDNYRYTVIPRLLSWLATRFPDHEKMTLAAYARFWQERLEQLHAFATRDTVQNVALVTATAPQVLTVTTTDGVHSYPFALETFLASELEWNTQKSNSSLLTRILTYFEIEFEVPVHIIDPRSVNGLLKIICKRAYALYGTVRVLWRR